MKRKKKAALPRVTVLAMSRAELVTFANAVDSLHLVALELDRQLRELRELVPRIRRPGRRAAEASASAELPAEASADPSVS